MVVGGIVILYGGGPFVLLVGCGAGYMLGDEIWYHCINNGFYYYVLTDPHDPCDSGYDGPYSGWPWPGTY